MFSKKTVLFVTGSSRGLGESTVLNLGPKFAPGSVIVLLARSVGDLQNVKKRLLENAPHLKAVVHPFDQSTQDPQAFDAVFSRTLEEVEAKVTDFQQAVLVNNAGTVEPVVFIRNLPDIRQLTQYMNVNVSGVIALTSQFLKVFPASSGFGRVVINISSLAAIKPIKSWAMYSSARAARDMFFKVLAAEEEDVRVINYSPGAVETAMTDVIVCSEDDEMRTWATNAKAEKTLLTCDASIARLIQILNRNAFENGAHVDYYDEV